MSNVGINSLPCLVNQKYKAYLISVTGKDAVVEMIDPGFTLQAVPVAVGQLASVPVGMVTIQRGGFKNEPKEVRK